MYLVVPFSVHEKFMRHFQIVLQNNSIWCVPKHSINVCFDFQHMKVLIYSHFCEQMTLSLWLGMECCLIVLVCFLLSASERETFMYWPLSFPILCIASIFLWQALLIISLLAILHFFTNRFLFYLRSQYTQLNLFPIFPLGWRWSHDPTLANGK